jgi:hypothetical protein
MLPRTCDVCLYRWPNRALRLKQEPTNTSSRLCQNNQFYQFDRSRRLHSLRKAQIIALIEVNRRCSRVTELGFHRLPRSHGRRSVQLVPRELTAFQRALDRLEQDHREQLPVCETL